MRRPWFWPVPLEVYFILLLLGIGAAWQWDHPQTIYSLHMRPPRVVPACPAPPPGMVIVQRWGCR